MFLYLLLLFSADRIPEPPEADLSKAGALVREVYGADQANAKTAQAKSDLAKRLLVDAADSEGKPAAQFVMWRAASSIAASAGDLETAIKACDELESHFIVYDTKLPILKQFTKANVAATLAMECADDAVSRDAYRVALEYLDVAESASRRDAEQLKTVREKRKHVSILATEYESLSSHLATLKKDALDEKANLAVGSFLCFRKNDWQNGLSYLVLTRTPLGAVALKDFTGATDHKEQMAIADGWWDIGDDATRDACRQRAAYWYRQALPSLTGIEKAKVEKLLDSLPKPVRQHYFDVAKPKDILFLAWENGTWQNDVSRGFSISKEKDGYRLGCAFTDGIEERLVLFPSRQPNKEKLTARITVLNGEVSFGYRPKDLSPKGAGFAMLPKGDYDIQLWIDANTLHATVNGNEVPVNNSPDCFGYFSMITSRRCSVVIRELYFE